VCAPSLQLTKWRGELKQRLEAGHAAGAQRGASQVLANSLLGALLAAATAWLRAASASGSSSAGAAASLTAAAFVGFYACCCADTWSSELGITSSAPPQLITTGRRVPPGTNGGVSTLGSAAAAAGGLLMGCCYCGAAALSTALRGSSSGAADWRLVPLALAAGMAGSLLDSLLGATLQYSGFDERSGRAVSGRPPLGQPVKHVGGRDALSNTGVNVAASLLTSALTAAVGARLLGP
jgi:uncharacterized protein (TIGR00297 family)